MGNAHFEIGALVVLGPLMVLFDLYLGLRARQGRPGWTGNHALTRLVAAAYATGVLTLTLFPLVVSHRESANRMPWTDQVQYVPTARIDADTLLNAVMMIPLGILLPLLSARATSLGRVAALTALAGLTIELAQLVSYFALGHARTTDVDDVIAYALGGAVGYVLLHVATLLPAAVRRLNALALPGSAASRPPYAAR